MSDILVITPVEIIGAPGITTVRWFGPDGALYETRISQMIGGIALSGKMHPLSGVPVGTLVVDTVYETKKVADAPAALPETNMTPSKPPGQGAN